MIDVAATDALLTTTRAVRRRLDLDRPVPRELVLECVSIAQQAPTGGNSQGWGFVVVTDEDKRAQARRSLPCDSGRIPQRLARTGQRRADPARL